MEVTVTTDGGTSSPTPGDLFTYTGLPSVSNVSPGGGPLAGGTLVTLTGVNFTSGATVSFGGVPCDPGHLRELDSPYRQVPCRIPA